MSGQSPDSGQRDKRQAGYMWDFGRAFRIAAVCH